MKRRWLVLFRLAAIAILLGWLLAVAIGAGLVWVDTSPLHRPDRPSHPSCVYQPPGTCPDK